MHKRLKYTFINCQSQRCYTLGTKDVSVKVTILLSLENHQFFHLSIHKARSLNHKK